MFLPSKRARTHTHTRAHRILPRFYSRRSSESLSEACTTFMNTHGYISTFETDSISFLRVNVHSIFIVAPFFFFLSVRTSAIWTRNCYFFPLSPPLTLLVSPVNYFPSLERRNYVSPPFARATCNTSSREFSIRLTIMFTRVTMDNSHAGI